MWGRHENEPVAYHFEMGVELVGAAARYNPFDGSDHSHLAAIELLRSARDLLKKTGVLMKKNGNRPHGVRRLFQAIKLTEGALPHARRSQTVDRRIGWPGQSSISETSGLGTKRIFRNTRGSNLALAQRDGDGAPLSLPAVNSA